MKSTHKLKYERSIYVYSIKQSLISIDLNLLMNQTNSNTSNLSSSQGFLCSHRSVSTEQSGEVHRIVIIVAKSLDGQQNPLPLSRCTLRCVGEIGSDPERDDDICLAEIKVLPLGCKHGLLDEERSEL